MSERKASLARLDSSSSTTSSQNEISAFRRTIDAILSPSRLAGLDAADVAPIPYDTYSFFSHILSLRGRNFSMLFSPLLLLLCWGAGWQLVFVYADTSNEIQNNLASLDRLVLPILTPLSFLLTFRLGRAAVRFWDARRSVGIIIGLCRTNMAMVSVGVISPIKHREASKILLQTSVDESIDGQAETQTRKVEPQEEDSIELMCQYARWLAVFPVAVNHHIRPQTRKGWNQDDLYKKYRYEIGTLLSDSDAQKVIMSNDDEKGLPTLSGGTRMRDSPLVVLNRLHQLAYDIAYCQTSSNDNTSSTHNANQAMLYQQITNQLKELTDAYGAMERIKNTPLPFAYAVHLRTFLLLYLFLWNMISVAEYGWVSIPFLFLLNWALLGIEAAAVECESPFEYRENHLTLGKVAVLISRNIGQAMKELAE